MNERFAQLSDRLRGVELSLTAKIAARDTLANAANNYITEINRGKHLEVVHQKVQKFFHSLGTEEQTKLQQWLERVISYGLQSVFNSEFFFVITGPTVKANDITLGFRVIEVIAGVKHERDPYNDMGGGMADVLSFLLQFLLVFLLKDRINPILILDESFKHLAADYTENMAAFLLELVERTGIQVFMVTHQPTYADVADVVYHFEKQGEQTRVKKVR